MRSHRSVLTDPIEEVILVEVDKESHECEEDPSERHALAQVETRIGLVAVEEQGPAEQGETEGGVERHATRKSETGRIQRFPEEPLIKPRTPPQQVFHGRENADTRNGYSTALSHPARGTCLCLRR